MVLVLILQASAAQSDEEQDGDKGLTETEFFGTPVDSNIRNRGYENAHAMDVNGDGKDDLVIAVDNVWKVLLSNGKGFDPMFSTNIRNRGYQNAHAMDVNGDGKGDLVIAVDNVWKILFNEGR